ncbi:S-adenosylmethionine:tRNA ribosyltransferase-isomerase [Alphaproteobacteria bacterium SO-S41]|nr:S-adenosylmethionine:tRNA ribosyltransferase-isomerase [Alphaproteobacteria bacterium SO-S41]
MRVADFDFDLPERLIALRPAAPRESARLLVIRPGRPLEDRTIADLPDLLTPGDTLVLNDTRVIPAAFNGVRAPRAASPLDQPQPLFGPKVSVNLHKRVGPNTWLAFIKGAKKIETGDRLTLNGAFACLVADKREEGEALLAFELEDAELDAAIAAHGTIPLPPYIAAKRTPDERDLTDYQTLLAARDGSVAAPTAGLHFTADLFERFAARGIARQTITLHVGAGTFLPVKADDTVDHRMHAEHGFIDQAAATYLNTRRAAGGRSVAVGTTSLRLMESAADGAGVIHPYTDDTAIFITPGYRFRAVDALITNFHLPRSTLFMLVSALAGLETMRAAYAHAIENAYRFYSYGDACLIFPEAHERA